MAIVPALLLGGCATLAEVDAAPPGAPVAGDPNGDGAADVSDAIFLINHMFRGGPEPVCDLAADALFDGVVNVADATGILSHTYLRETDLLGFDAGACGLADASRARPARRVGLAWDAEERVTGPAGSAVPFSATVTLQTLDKPVQGWAFSIVPSGCTIDTVTTDGTAAAWVNATPAGVRASTSFDRHAIVRGVGEAAVVLDLHGDAELPVGDPAPVLVVTGHGTPTAGGCAPCALTIPDRRAAGRVGTVATINGWSYPMEGAELRLELCEG